MVTPFDLIRVSKVAARACFYRQLLSVVPRQDGNPVPVTAKYLLILLNTSSNKRTMVGFLGSLIEKATTHLLKISETTRIIVLPVFVLRYGPIKSFCTAHAYFQGYVTYAIL